jgi:hypothetical protein
MIRDFVSGRDGKYADDRYGKGFSKLADGPKYDVYYGDQKARHVEARW